MGTSQWKFKSFPKWAPICDIENRLIKRVEIFSSTIYALIHKAPDVNSTDEFISLIKDGLKARVSSNIPFIGLDHIELFFEKLSHTIYIIIKIPKFHIKL